MHRRGAQPGGGCRMVSAARPGSRCEGGRRRRCSWDPPDGEVSPAPAPWDIASSLPGDPGATMTCVVRQGGRAGSRTGPSDAPRRVLRCPRAENHEGRERPEMDDVVAKTRSDQDSQPRLDLQSHIADLEARGLLTRIDHPVNKDTELHPLVRLQFIGGIPENERRAFLFTNVVDAKGRRYDMPAVVGAIAASAEVYSLGMRRAIDDIGNAWIEAIAHPIAPVRTNAPRCQEVVIRGDDLRKPDGGLKLLPVPVSTPGFDAAPYLTATFCVTKDPDSGIQNGGTYRAALKATDRAVVRMVARAGGAGGYQHWVKHNKRKVPMPIAIGIG